MSKMFATSRHVAIAAAALLFTTLAAAADETSTPWKIISNDTLAPWALPPSEDRPPRSFLFEGPTTEETQVWHIRDSSVMMGKNILSSFQDAMCKSADSMDVVSENAECRVIVRRCLNCASSWYSVTTTDESSVPISHFTPVIIPLGYQQVEAREEPLIAPSDEISSLTDAINILRSAELSSKERDALEMVLASMPMNEDPQTEDVLSTDEGLAADESVESDEDLNTGAELEDNQEAVENLVTDVGMDAGQGSAKDLATDTALDEDQGSAVDLATDAGLNAAQGSWIELASGYDSYNSSTSSEATAVSGRPFTGRPAFDIVVPFACMFEELRQFARQDFFGQVRALYDLRLVVTNFACAGDIPDHQVVAQMLVRLTGLPRDRVAVLNGKGSFSRAKALNIAHDDVREGRESARILFSSSPVLVRAAFIFLLLFCIGAHSWCWSAKYPDHSYVLTR
jgi:hypothetical protein